MQGSTKVMMSVSGFGSRYASLKQPASANDYCSQSEVKDRPRWMVRLT